MTEVGGPPDKMRLRAFSRWFLLIFRPTAWVFFFVLATVKSNPSLPVGSEAVVGLFLSVVVGLPVVFWGVLRRRFGLWLGIPLASFVAALSLASGSAIARAIAGEPPSLALLAQDAVLGLTVVPTLIAVSWIARNIFAFWKLVLGGRIRATVALLSGGRWGTGGRPTLPSLMTRSFSAAIAKVRQIKSIRGAKKDEPGEGPS